MIDQDHIELIRQALLECGKAFDSAELFPTVVPGAAGLVVSDPYAFSIATCLDRGTKADIIWTIPYDIKNLLGHLDPYGIYQMSLEELAEMFARLPRKPRFKNDAPRTVMELTKIIVEEYGGHADMIWEGKNSDQVKKKFDSVYGVGVGIANMAVLLIEKAFPYRFSDLDRPSMDIKPDTHTRRVLYRLGVSEAETDKAAIVAARLINPAYPGEIDGVLWLIGRTWCHPINPDCQNCCMTKVCAKRID